MTGITACLAGVWHTNTPDVLYIKYASSQIPNAKHLGQNLAHLDDPTLDNHPPGRPSDHQPGAAVKTLRRGPAPAHHGRLPGLTRVPELGPVGVQQEPSRRVRQYISRDPVPHVLLVGLRCLLLVGVSVREA